MSGHSKWSTIKRKKEKTDNARAKVFTKIGREISVAVKEGGADPANNSKLRDLIAKAKANNVPNDNIDRVIKKAAGDGGKNDYETIVYEGYGPGGVAVIVETLTDNRNRTASDMRHYFDKFGGNLGTSGCVSFLFEEKGVILVEADQLDEDQALEDCLDAGAQDVQFAEGGATVLTEPADFSAVREALEQKGYSFASAQVEMTPQTTTRLTDQDHKQKMRRLLDILEDDDDVQDVWHNLENEEELPD